MFAELEGVTVVLRGIRLRLNCWIVRSSDIPRPDRLIRNRFGRVCCLAQLDCAKRVPIHTLDVPLGFKTRVRLSGELAA